MQIHVRFRPRRQEDRSVELPAGGTVADLMAACDVPVDVFVAVRGNVPVAEDAVLADGDDIVLMSAASGG